MRQVNFQDLPRFEDLGTLEELPCPSLHRPVWHVSRSASARGGARQPESSSQAPLYVLASTDLDCRPQLVQFYVARFQIEFSRDSTIYGLADVSACRHGPRFINAALATLNWPG